MALSAKAKSLIAEIGAGDVKMGDLKKRAKEIKKDHALATELWATELYYPRLLATLIFDKKLLTEEVVTQLAADMLCHDLKERSQLADWLMAKQLAKEKKLAALMAPGKRAHPPSCNACSGTTRLAYAGQDRRLPTTVRTC